MSKYTPEVNTPYGYKPPVFGTSEVEGLRKIGGGSMARIANAFNALGLVVHGSHYEKADPSKASKKALELLDLTAKTFAAQKTHLRATEAGMLVAEGTNGDNATTIFMNTLLSLPAVQRATKACLVADAIKRKSEIAESGYTPILTPDERETVVTVHTQFGVPIADGSYITSPPFVSPWLYAVPKDIADTLNAVTADYGKALAAPFEAGI